MTEATFSNTESDKSDFDWSPSGRLLLELIESEIRNNGVYVYARENLSQIEFEEFTRKYYLGGGEK